MGESDGLDKLATDKFIEWIKFVAYPSIGCEGDYGKLLKLCDLGVVERRERGLVFYVALGVSGGRMTLFRRVRL
jgi:hypothetical protein